MLLFTCHKRELRYFEQYLKAAGVIQNVCLKQISGRFKIQFNVKRFVNEILDLRILQFNFIEKKTPN